MLTTYFHKFNKNLNLYCQVSQLITRVSNPIKYNYINQRFVNKLTFFKTLKDKLLPFNNTNPFILKNHINLRNYLKLLINKLSPSVSLGAISKPFQNNLVKTSLKSSVTNNNLFLPEEEQLIGLSGLASLQESFRLKLKTDIVLNKIFSKFLLIEKAKILIYLFDKPYTEDEFIFRVFKCFSLIVSKQTLGKNKLLENIYKDKYVSTIQHMLTILLHKKQFNISSLITSKFVDFSHYKKIPISVIIENFVFYEITKEFQLSNSIFNIKAIDHLSHLINDPFDIYKRCESNKQISQLHSDFLLYKIISNKDGIEIIRFYRDVKADYRGTSTGHFTIIPFLYTDSKIALQYMNNPISFLIGKIKENPHYTIFQLDLNILINTRERLKNSKDNLKQIIIDFNQVLLNMSLNELYINADINLTVACDFEFDNDFQHNILPLIEKELEEYYNLLDIDDIFPKNNKIKINAYERKMHEIINKIIPKELQNNIRDNYNKYIENDSK